MFQAISCAEIIHYRKNQIVIDEGERTKGIYYLLSGGCEIQKKVVSNSAERDIQGSKNGKGKENCVKILKLVKNSFVGELEVLLAIN